MAALAAARCLAQQFAHLREQGFNPDRLAQYGCWRLREGGGDNQCWQMGMFGPKIMPGIPAVHAVDIHNGQIG
jgi:hypothetical protein